MTPETQDYMGQLETPHYLDIGPTIESLTAWLPVLAKLGMQATYLSQLAATAALTNLPERAAAYNRLIEASTHLREIVQTQQDMQVGITGLADAWRAVQASSLAVKGAGTG